MSVNDRKDLGQIPTVPSDLNQRPRFGAITETTKDVFVTELRMANLLIGYFNEN